MKQTDDRQVRPLGDNVLCRMLVMGNRITTIGLHLPSTATGRPRLAEVVATGKGVDLDISIGDTVTVDPYKLRVVMAEGSAAESPGSPLAQGGDFFLIGAADIIGVNLDEEGGPSGPQIVAALDTIRRAGGFEDAQEKAEGASND